MSATDGSRLLQQAAAEGVEILTNLSTVCHSRYQCPPLSPAYIGEAKGVLLLRGSKMGLGFGFGSSHGILLARLPSRTSPGVNTSEPPRWSAPVFVKVTTGHAGFIASFERVDSFLLAMTTKVLNQLQTGSHSVLGVDQSMVMFQSEVEDKSDIIAASNKSVDLAGVNHSSGVMLDFSLTGGSMSVNAAKMRQVYGQGVGMAEIIKGMVPPPADLEPLYEKLAELVVGATTPSISLTTTNLQRMTAGGRMAAGPELYPAPPEDPMHATTSAVGGRRAAVGGHRVTAVPLEPAAGPASAMPPAGPVATSYETAGRAAMPAGVTAGVAQAGPSTPEIGRAPAGVGQVVYRAA